MLARSVRVYCWLLNAVAVLTHATVPRTDGPVRMVVQLWCRSSTCNGCDPQLATHEIELHSGTENTRAAGCLAENLLDPRTAFSQEPTEAAFQLALGTKLTHFDWLDLPENAEKLKKFGVAMGATTNYNDGKVATQGGWLASCQTST